MFKYMKYYSVNVFQTGFSLNIQATYHTPGMNALIATTPGNIAPEIIAVFQ